MADSKRLVNTEKNIFENVLFSHALMQKSRHNGVYMDEGMRVERDDVKIVSIFALSLCPTKYIMKCREKLQKSNLNFENMTQLL